MNQDVQLVPIDRIRILNPRYRDRRKFEELVMSVKNLGLKKPIKISRRIVKSGEEEGYDLVFGQGRIEAFRALGCGEIPAIVVEISKEDRLLISLVENMARRFPSPMGLILEIERLKKLGHTNVAIGKKLDMAETSIGNLLSLRKAGEERLLDATIKGKVPLSVAVEIAKTDGKETQRAMLKAFESQELPHVSIRVVKKLVNQREYLGKAIGHQRGAQKPRPTVASLVNAYKKESQKQKDMVKKARICEAKWLIVNTAFKRLLVDEDFINLLRAEKLASIPACIAEAVRQLL